MSAGLRLILMRHGEPVGGERIRGRVDDPLSDTGWQQMQQSAERLRVDRVVSSPLLRCQAFAQAWSAAQGLPLEVDADLQEMGMGSWEGLTRADIFADDPQGYWRFQADPVGCMPPGGETLQAAAVRAGRVLTRLQALPEGQQVLVVAHSGIMRLMVAQALALPFESAMRIKLPYACQVTLEGRNLADGWVWLLRWPDLHG